MDRNSLASSTIGNIKPARLHGVWRKDFQSSDMKALQTALEVMKLPKMQKVAATTLIDGMSIDMRQQDRATINFLTRIPFYKVSEEFREGQETRMKRRDLRPGQQRAIAECIEQDEMRVNIAWDGDMPGRVHETFQLNERGQMIVRGTMIIGDRELVVTQVYNKEK